MTWKGLKTTGEEGETIHIKDTVNWGTGRLCLIQAIKQVNGRITVGHGTGSPILHQNMFPFQKSLFW